MKKIFIYLLSIVSVLTVLSGCNKNKSNIPEHGTFDPEPYYAYGFREECSDGTNYCTIQSMEITASYTVGDGVQESSSGYYVIVGIDTNLSDENLSHAGNHAKLELPRGEWGQQSV